ncbi:MAG: lamin tail domain-containing protein, partial [Bacteroidales bacterium]
MKKIKYNILVLLGFLVLASNVTAQNMSDMCINEFLVTNTDDFVNDFGHRTGWVELFNTSYGTVNIGGCYITNDPNNLTKYVIQRGDELTKIKPRQHILFWADGEPHRGTFHLNFTLKESKEIILVSSDGKTIIDRVEIPHDLLSENVSYGRIKDGVTVMATKENQDVE